MVVRSLIVVLLLSFAGVAAAHRPTVQECREVADFVRNAALSRDNGMPREVFLNRLQGDLIVIKGYAPELRWFVQDQDDEDFLLEAVERVFAAPTGAAEHQATMLRNCLARLGAGLT